MPLKLTACHCYEHHAWYWYITESLYKHVTMRWIQWISKSNLPIFRMRPSCSNVIFMNFLARQNISKYCVICVKQHRLTLANWIAIVDELRKFTSSQSVSVKTQIKIAAQQLGGKINWNKLEARKQKQKKVSDKSIRQQQPKLVAYESGKEAKKKKKKKPHRNIGLSHIFT